MPTATKTRKTTTRKTAKAKVAKTPAKGRSTLDAAAHVLAAKGEPMHHHDIAKAILSRKLAPGLKGKTPEMTISAALTMAAKNGGRFVKTAPGTFALGDQPAKRATPAKKPASGAPAAAKKEGD